MKRNNENLSNVTILNSHHIEVETRFLLCNKSVLNKTWYANNEICSHSTIYYILEGELLLTIDGEEILAQAGDFVLIPAETKHNYHLPYPYYAKLYWVDAILNLNGNTLGTVFSFPYKITVGANSKIKSIFKKLMNLQYAPDPYSTSIQQSHLLTDLLLLYMRYSVTPFTALTKSHDSVWTTVEYINAHYTEKITIEQLANMAYLSKNQFTIRFKKLTGMPPLQYLIDVKLRHAQKLLETTNMSIAEIVNALNFYDPAQFCRTFKKTFSFSPNVYRKLSQTDSVLRNGTAKPIEKIDPYDDN